MPGQNALIRWHKQVRRLSLLLSLGLVLLGFPAWVQGLENPPAVGQSDADRLVVPFYSIDDPIGTLRIPSVDIEVTVYQDDNPQNITRGGGHYLGSFLPGQGGNILIAGHRSRAVFYNFKALEPGDLVYFETTYGYYVYQVDRFQIIEGSDDSIAAETAVEQLTMYTCYPFDYKGNAPQRYVFFCVPVAAPDAPDPLMVRQVSPTRIQLDWTAVSGASRYEIYRSASPAGPFRRIYTAVSTRFVNTRRSPGKTYYYKVRAYAKVDGQKILGPFSQVHSQEPIDSSP